MIRLPYRCSISYYLCGLIAAFLFTTGAASATSLFQNAQTDFLKAEEAFQGSVNLDNNTLLIHWRIAEGYYLYKDKFFLKTTPESVALGDIAFDHPGIMKMDETFGEVEVYYQNVTLSIPIIKAPKDFTVNVHYQGCAEAGLCYLPKKIEQSFRLSTPIDSTNSTVSTDSTIVLKNTASSPESTPTQETDNKLALDRHDANSLHQFLAEGSLLPKLLLFFLLGIGLTFTPCVLPMIPILTGVIAGQQQPLTLRKGFFLSSSYVLGMALTFAVIGLIIGLTGAKVQVWLQNPYVLTGFALIFVVLAFSMFGFYELQLPRFLQDKLSQAQQKQQGGHIISVFLMGALSALVVSPCVSAPLAGALLYVTNEGSALVGALILFSLGLGMGAPLIAIGTTGANILPKAGAWMDQVKVFFGVLLLAVGTYFLRTVLPSNIMMGLWALLLILPGVYFGAFRTADTGWQSCKKGLSLIAIVYGILLIAGLSLGATNPLKPLHPLISSSTPAKHLDFQRLSSLSSLNSELEAAAKRQQPVMLDYYADWCIACIEMEHDAFQDHRVIDALKNFKLLQVDLTDNPEAQALLDQFELIGPPSILFFDESGHLMPSSAVMGEMNADRFFNHLNNKVIGGTPL